MKKRTLKDYYQSTPMDLLENEGDEEFEDVIIVENQREDVEDEDNEKEIEPVPISGEIVNSNKRKRGKGIPKLNRNIVTMKTVDKWTSDPRFIGDLVKKEGKPFCFPCNQALYVKDVGKIVEHFSTDKHKSNKLQPFQTQLFTTDNLLDIAADWCLCVHLSGNSFHSFEKMVWIVKKRCENGGSIPSSSELFMKPTEDIFTITKKGVLSSLKDKSVSIVVDEAADKVRKKKVLNLCGTSNSQGFLLGTDFLESSPKSLNITTFLKNQVTPLLKEGIRVFVIVHDSAPYMIKGVRNFLILFKEDLGVVINVNCSAHLFDIVIREFINSSRILSSFLSCLRRLFVATSNRFAYFKEYMWKEYKLNLNKPPLGGEHRSWLSDRELLEWSIALYPRGNEKVRLFYALFHWVSIEETQVFAEETKVKQDLLKIQEQNNELHLLIKVALLATEPLAVFLVQCQARSRTIHKVYNTWEDAKNYFNCSQNWSLPSNCAQLFEKHPEILKKLSNEMEMMFKAASEKIKSGAALIEKTTWPIFSSARALDPLQMISDKPPKLELEKIPFSNEYEFGNSILKYQMLLKTCDKQDLEKDQDPSLFFLRYKTDLEPFSSFALKVLQIPTSSAEVERSFSIYKRLVSPNRPRLSDEMIKHSLFINYNFQNVFPNYTVRN